MRKFKLLSGILLICFLFTMPGTVLAFNDIRYHWARPQIEYLKSRDMVSGYADNSYRPDSYISRAEFITLLISFHNQRDEASRLAKGATSFKDVFDDYWAKGYIELASELGIAQGDDRGNFRPHHLISREEAVVMLVNSLKVKVDIAEEDLDLDLLYKDYDKISPWAKKAIYYAAKQKLISGYPDGEFKPQNKLTRAEVTVIFENLLELQGRKYHFQGTLLDINLPLKQATVKLSSGEETFEIAENIVVYKEGSTEPVKELNLPVDVYFNLNNKGKLSYIYITEELKPSNIKLLFSSLPESSKMVTVDSRVVKLTDPEIYEINTELASNNPALSMETTKAAMRVQDFVRETGATGRGQLVAVIDSGVDVGHPDLQKTTDGYIKIVDFVDLTDEGKVTLSGPIKAENGQLVVDGQRIDVTEIKNEAGEFLVGYLGTSFMPKVISESLPKDRFLVVVTASQYFNTFDTVYIDTNMDGQIKDEVPVMKYSRNNQVVSIKGTNNKVFNMVVSDIDGEKKYVKFGFDAIGHGTEVAGIVAANGKIEGVAPGAQILPIKVLNNLGLAYLDRLENAI
ncbi:MAG: S8 family serine peptidase, partial [Syntrophomonadaceae bacterium]|nr:S8 family serine peptidase [Syntrophomonadaceae bacterium]